MAVAPTPSEILKRGVKEGERRLDQSLLELVSTGFIAGFTIVFGVVGIGIVHAALEPNSGLAKLVGALVFGIGVVFLVVGRAELFSENFFDPVATVVEQRRPGKALLLIRLWAVTLLLNLVGGALLAFILAAEGALPHGAPEALNKVAEEAVGRGPLAGFVKAVAGGTLITLLSFLLHAVNGVGSRIALAYLVGFMLALGPFEHVVVTALYGAFGLLFGANIEWTSVVWMLLLVTAGNLVGGLGLVTLTHIAQGEGEQRSDE